MIKLTADTFATRFPTLAAPLEADELQAFVNLLKVQELEASEALIAEGTETNSLFFLWDGELNVVMNTPEGERQVARISDNEMMGEISLISPGPATATVRSDAGCTALHLDRASLEVFWREHPHAASIFLNVLCRQVAARIRHANETLSQLLDEQEHNAEALVAVHTQLFEG